MAKICFNSHIFKQIGNNGMIYDKFVRSDMNLGKTRFKGRPRNRWQDEVREDE
jgi:hypothetical protein